MRINNYLLRVMLYKLDPDVVGLSSKTEDNMHIIMLDYDNISKRKFLLNVYNVQKKFYLPNFYLFKSSKNSYHAICLMKQSSGQIVDICLYAKVDVNYLAKSIKRGQWTLRISQKHDKSPPEYIGSLKATPVNNRLHSRAHYEFLKKIYNLLEEPEEKLDNSKKVILEKYASKNVVF